MSAPTLRIPSLLALTALPLCADVTPATLFQNFAVLQQGRPVPVWGTADPAEKVTVTYAAGTTTRTATTTAGSDGKWRVELPALAASAQAGTLTFTGKNTVARDNILVGEVWLASGQSNMEWALSWKNKVVNARAEIAAADFPLIREIKIRPASAKTSRDNASGAWRACSPATAGGFGAVAYFFARNLHQNLNIPVGIISCAWSGAAIEPFITPASLATDPNGATVLAAWDKRLADYPAAKARHEAEMDAWTKAKSAALKTGGTFNEKAPAAPIGPGHQTAPSGAFNAMIHPLVPYALRGAIWYQGASNVGRHVQYRTFFPSLIAGWRTVFEQSEMPFYWVQLANYAPKGDHRGLAFSWLRDAQNQTLSIPNTGQAITIDVGEAGDIHPAKKQEVGDRLARLALRRTYRRTDVIDSGPTLGRVELKTGTPGRIRVRFDNVAGGLKNTHAADPSAVSGFEVAGPDKNFRAAESRIENKTTGVVLVTAPASVPTPTYVRYAFRNDPKATLFNSEGLPAAPFRTDP